MLKRRIIFHLPIILLAFIACIALSIVTLDASSKTGQNIYNKNTHLNANNPDHSLIQKNGLETSKNTDFRDETIYFVITTRFFDGDLSNNARTGGDEIAKNPLCDPSWRGDFKGLIEKLDYIKALGFTSIWITPVVENRSFYDYHGYHGYDFNKVDSRYESDGYDFQRLIDECHSRNMKLILDIVLNHSCNYGAKGLYESTSNSFTTRINQLFATPFYHNSWLKNWEDYTCQTGSIAGDCIDFNTENPDTRNYLINAYNKFIDMGVDGFRIDTVKHISRVTLNRYFLPAFQKRGGKDFFMFGEVCSRVHEIWNKGVPPLSVPFYTWKERSSYNIDDTIAAKEGYDFENIMGTSNQPISANHKLNDNLYHTPDYTNFSGLNVIDFSAHWNFTDAASAFNKHTDDIYYNDATQNIVYVDSHDYGPNMNTRYNGGTASWAENLDLMFTWRGIPCLYYGSEIEFQSGVDVDVGPNSPLSQTGRAYFGDNIEGTLKVSDFSKYTSASGPIADTLSKPLSKHIARLNMIRKAIPALQKGQYSTDGCSGSISYKKRYTDNSSGIDSFCLVTISGNSTFKKIPNGTYVDAITGNSIAVTNGTLTATCQGKGNMRIYVLNLPSNPAPGMIGSDTTYLH